MKREISPLQAITPLLLAIGAVLIVACSAVAVAQSRWDSSYKPICHVTVDAGTWVRCTTSGTGKYVMGDCDQSTRTGSAQQYSDGGISKPCILTDGGTWGCRNIRYGSGEKFYAQQLPAENVIIFHSTSGISTCDGFEGQ